MEDPYNEDYVIMGKEFVDKTDENTISKFEIPKHIVFIYNDIRLVPNKVFINWKKLNPNYKLIFFNFEDASYFLQHKLNKNYKNYFNKITHAPHKSDYFRMCFLYIYGGIYSDIDNVPLKPIESFYQPHENIKFLTCNGISKTAFAQAIICSTRLNSYIDKCLQEYINILENLKIRPIYYKNYSGAPISGTRIMYDTVRKILIDNKQTDDIISVNKKYVVIEDIDRKRFENNMVLLEEYKPDGRWQNSHMRNINDTVIKSRYDDYPWYGHERTPKEGYETYY